MSGVPTKSGFDTLPHKHQGIHSMFEQVYHHSQSKEKVTTMLEFKTFRVWFGATRLMCAMFCAATLSSQEKQHPIESSLDTYRIGIGDQIKIDVWRHPELSKTVVVDCDGNITLPSINVVKAS